MCPLSPEGGQIWKGLDWLGKVLWQPEDLGRPSLGLDCSLRAIGTEH